MLLTVLLPLRSALALTMGLQACGDHANISLMAAAEPLPCAHHGADISPQHAPQDSLHSDPGQSHLLCDICNVPALGQTAELVTGTSLLPVGLAPRSERFVSVVLPIGHKPPIPA